MAFRYTDTEDIEIMLEGSGIQAGEDHFTVENMSLPFITYSLPEQGNLCADNIVYVKIRRLLLEAYTANENDPALKKLEHTLERNDISYSRSNQFWNEEQQVFQTNYSMEVIENGE